MRKGGSRHSTAVPAGKVDKRKNEFKTAIKQVFNEDEFLKVLQALREKALQGELKAIEMVLHYVAGKPTERMEIQQLEPKEFEVHVVDNTYHIGDTPAVKFTDK